ncbi:unnamed protein product, partial [Chrysoparadoxa australica]
IDRKDDWVYGELGGGLIGWVLSTRKGSNYLECIADEELAGREWAEQGKPSQPTVEIPDSVDSQPVGSHKVANAVGDRDGAGELNKAEGRGSKLAQVAAEKELKGDGLYMRVKASAKLRDEPDTCGCELQVLHPGLVMKVTERRKVGSQEWVLGGCGCQEGWVLCATKRLQFLESVDNEEQAGREWSEQAAAAAKAEAAAPSQDERPIGGGQTAADIPEHPAEVEEVIDTVAESGTGAVEGKASEEDEDRKRKAALARQEKLEEAAAARRAKEEALAQDTS